MKGEKQILAKMETAFSGPTRRYWKADIHGTG